MISAVPGQTSGFPLLLAGARVRALRTHRREWLKLLSLSAATRLVEMPVLGQRRLSPVEAYKVALRREAARLSEQTSLAAASDPSHERDWAEAVAYRGEVLDRLVAAKKLKASDLNSLREAADPSDRWGMMQWLAYADLFHQKVLPGITGPGEGAQQVGGARSYLRRTLKDAIRSKLEGLLGPFAGKLADVIPEPAAGGGFNEGVQDQKARAGVEALKTIVENYAPQEMTNFDGANVLEKARKSYVGLLALMDDTEKDGSEWLSATTLFYLFAQVSPNAPRGSYERCAFGKMLVGDILEKDHPLYRQWDSHQSLRWRGEAVWRALRQSFREGELAARGAVPIQDYFDKYLDPDAKRNPRHLVVESLGKAALDQYEAAPDVSSNPGQLTKKQNELAALLFRYAWTYGLMLLL